jgi:hypothetical protein
MKGFSKGDFRASAAGQKGGAIRGTQRQRESILHWTQKFPGVSVEAARAIYEQAYKSGWAAGRKRRVTEYGAALAAGVSAGSSERSRQA